MFLLRVLKLINGENILGSIEVDFDEEKESEENPFDEKLILDSSKTPLLDVYFPLELIRNFNFKSGEHSFNFVKWQPWADCSSAPIPVAKDKILAIAVPTDEVANHYEEFVDVTFEKSEEQIVAEALEENSSAEGGEIELKSPEDWNNFLRLVSIPTKIEH